MKTATIIQSRSAARCPGDMLREMTAPVADSQGRTWPAGTRYLPVSFGCDGDVEIVTIDIAGATVEVYAAE